MENGCPGSAGAALRDLLAEQPAPPVRIVRPGRNLGFGAGVNRGLAALGGGVACRPNGCSSPTRTSSSTPARSSTLRDVLESHPAWAVVGPRIFTDVGDVYPSVRNFPSLTDAAGHALLALFNPENRFTRRYNPGAPEGDVVIGAGLGLGFVLPRPAERTGGARWLRRGLLHVQRGHGPVLARPRRPGGVSASPVRPR